MIFYRFIIFFFLFIVAPNFYCQTPSNSTNWLTTPPIKFDDEFNGTSVNYIWAVWAPSWNSNNGYDFIFLPNNVTCSGGYLNLRAELCPSCNSYNTPGHNYQISSGSLYTGPYLYGYYEARCFMESYGPSYMPAFWLQSNSATSPAYYNEIDMEIRSGTPLFDLTTTDWFSASSSPAAATYTGNFSPTPGLQYGFHKYAIEWTPNHVVFYYDDVPFDAIWANIPSHAMRIIFTLGFYYSSGHTSNSFPGLETVDYVRVYDLDNTYCANNVTFSSTSPFNGSTYDFKVKNSITFALNNNTVINSGNYFFRAGEFTIQGDFEVQGTDFTLLPTSCY